MTDINPRVLEQRERERNAAAQPGTVSEGCANGWHLTAAPRLRQTCPECPSVTEDRR